MTVGLVSGAIANKPGNGGAAWTRLSWTLGLAELGFDVHFVEQIHGADATAEAWFSEVIGHAGLQPRATLLRADGSTAQGLPKADLIDLAAGAALLLNVSGHLRDPAILARVGQRVFIDLDPGYTQIWHAEGIAELAPHDHWYTVGHLVGTGACSVPTSGIAWRPIRQPVVLRDWPVQEPLPCDRFTTVASWRGPYGTVDHDGATLGGKVHQFRRFAQLPNHLDASVQLATDIGAADALDRDLLLAGGWEIVDAATVAGSPHDFRRYVQRSPAELSVAQGVYVQPQTGWFGDRSVRYLASGRPVVVQDTGFSQDLAVGEGLLAFRTEQEAQACAEAVMCDYIRHSKAARELAETCFAAPVVLGSLCSEIGLAP